MVNEILTGAGFVLNETFKETRFLKPPTVSYCIYNDTKTRRGADEINLLSDHDVSIELYEYAPDPGAEARLEAQLDMLALEYTKESRYWISDEGLYQVVYDFFYVEKED